MNINYKIIGEYIFAISCGVIGFIVTWNVLQPEYITKILMKIFHVK